MKIKEIRTRVIEWRGKTVPLPPHFCTNPMDAVSPMLTISTMGTFTFHSWLICEIVTDTGLVGIGNAALSPRNEASKGYSAGVTPVRSMIPASSLTIKARSRRSLGRK